MSDETEDPPESSSKKQKWLKFRALDDDEEIIDGKADEAGLCRSEYMRQISRNGKIVTRQISGASRDEINQTKQHGYSIMYLLKEYRTRGHPPSGNLDALFATQQQYYKHLLEKALQGVDLT